MVKMLLESAGTYGFGGGVSEAALKKYTAEYGEQLIAMETLTEQHEVFEAAFYDIEVAEFQAMMESYGTDSEPVMESISGKISAGIAKIKAMLKKLWEKIKAFFYNVKRFLDGVFMDGQDFVKKYKKDFSNLKLSGFSYDMYKYTFDKVDIADSVDIAQRAVDEYSDIKALSTMDKNMVDKTVSPGVTVKVDGNVQDYQTKDNGDVDESPTLSDEDKAERYAEYGKSMGITASIDTLDELREEIWSALRSDVNFGDAPDSQDISSVSEHVTILETSRKDLQKFDRAASKTDSLYSKALKNITAIEKAIPKGYEGNETLKKRALSQCRATYNEIALLQTVENAAIGEIRAAIVERNKQYKGMLLKALTYKEPKKD